MKINIVISYIFCCSALLEIHRETICEKKEEGMSEKKIIAPSFYVLYIVYLLYIMITTRNFRMTNLDLSLMHHYPVDYAKFV